LEGRSLFLVPLSGAATSAAICRQYLTTEIPTMDNRDVVVDLSLKCEIILLLSKLYSASFQNVANDVHNAGIDEFVDRLEAMGY
jgi:hypothetical protein